MNLIQLSVPSAFGWVHAFQRALELYDVFETIGACVGVCKVLWLDASHFIDAHVSQPWHAMHAAGSDSARSPIAKRGGLGTRSDRVEIDLLHQEHLDGLWLFQAEMDRPCQC